MLMSQGQMLSAHFVYNVIGQMLLSQFYLFIYLKIQIPVKCSHTFARNNYDCQIRNIQGIIDVKEEKIWLTNLKYLWLSPNTSLTLVFSKNMHLCTISKIFGMNKELDSYPPR